LQDYEVEAFKGLDLIFIHNHPNGSDASEADLRAAFAAGAEMLMVVTPQGYEYVYVRGARGMIRIRAEEASYEVAPGTAEEHALLEARSWAQTQADRLNPPEWMMLQEEREPYVPTIGLKVSGTLRLYPDELFDRVDTPFLPVIAADNSPPLRVFGYSQLNPHAVWIELGDWKFWVDISDPDAEMTFVPLMEHGDSSTKTMEEVVATGAPSGYEILPIVPDERAHGGSSNIETSDEEWADRTGRDNDPKTKRGLLSRDYNHVPDEDDPEKIHESFQLQSPVIGPDVRVEFVVRGHETLGNYVVISFPASVYQSDEEIMQQLAMQGQAAAHLNNQSLAPHLTEEERSKMERMASIADHNPDRWHEDGRIFYAFAHLSKIYVNAEETINSRDRAIIGLTGKSGTNQHHLDLAILYVGSSNPGSGAMETELNILRSEYKRKGSNSVSYFFGLVERSQLYPTNNRFILYAENMDSARLHPELDESGIAEYMKGYSIYAQ